MTTLKQFFQIRIVILFLPLLLIFGCKSKDDKAAAPAPNRNAMRGGPIEVEGFVARTKAVSENLDVPGTLLPMEETEIRPEISGRIVSLYLQEGNNVVKGALLAKLFDEDLQAQLKKLQVQLAIAEKTLERQRELLKINGISQQEVDLSELQVNNIKADIDLVKVNIAKTEIRAPYAGVLGLRNISVGAYVSPTTPITTLRSVSQLKLDFTVPEKYGTHFGKGKQVEFTVAGSPRKHLAVVVANEPVIEQSTRTLKIRANVRTKERELLPGAFAKVLLNLGGESPSVIVPSQAVIPKARSKEVILYRNGIPTFQTVTTGVRDSSYVQITDGLSAGDTVVITGLLAIRPDSKIKLVKTQ